MVDGREDSLPLELIKGEPSIIKAVCDRKFGIGADGIILVLNPSAGADVRMQIFNSDGTEAEMCGNGIRCLVKFLLDNSEVAFRELKVETLAGQMFTEVEKSGDINVDMGAPSFDPPAIPTTLTIGQSGMPEGIIQIDNNRFKVYSLGMGNPHMITYVDDFKFVELKRWGPLLEKNNYFPAYTNVHFVKVISDTQIEVLVWERGCGATLACGTGACACLVTSSLLNLTKDSSQVKLPGGILHISWPKKTGSVKMIGPAKFVFSGVYRNAFISQI